MTNSCHLHPQAPIPRALPPPPMATGFAYGPGFAQTSGFPGVHQVQTRFHSVIAIIPAHHRHHPSAVFALCGQLSRCPNWTRLILRHDRSVSSSHGTQSFSLRACLCIAEGCTGGNRLACGERDLDPQYLYPHLSSVTIARSSHADTSLTRAHLTTGVWLHPPSGRDPFPVWHAGPGPVSARRCLARHRASLRVSYQHQVQTRPHPRRLDQSSP
jgi:hypothetical protein